MTYQQGGASGPVTWSSITGKPTTVAGLGLSDGVDDAALAAGLATKSDTVHTHDASEIVSGVLAPTRLGTGTPSGTKFLRGDGAWETATASPTATTVEVSLSATATWTGKFTITDAAISGTSKVFCWQAPGPYTGKGTLADEAELQPVSVIAVEPAAGSAVVKWQTPPMLVESPVPTRGSNAGLAGTTARNRDYQTTATRIGKVRGNVKFSYMVLA